MTTFPLFRPVRSARYRLMANLFLVGLFEALFVLILMLLVPAAAAKLWGVDWSPFLLLWALPLAIPYAVWKVYRRGITDASASIAVDDRFRLEERVSSAWILRDRTDPMTELLRSDANRFIDGVRVRDRFPIVFPVKAFWMVPALVVFVGVCLWLPPLPVEKPEAPAVVVEKKPPLPKEKADEIAKILQKPEEKPSVKEDLKAATGIAQLREPLDQLADRIRKEKLSKHEALSSLSEQQRKLEEKKERLAKLDQARSRLTKSLEDQKFAKDVRKSLSEGRYSTAAQGLESLSSKLSSGDLSKADLEQLRSELESLSKGLDGNAELQESLAAALSALKAASGREGSKGLSAGDLKKLEQALASASVDLAELQKWADNLEGLESMLSDIDLAKLSLSGNLGQCQSCGKICSGTGEAHLCKGCQGVGRMGGVIGAGAGGSGPGMGGPGRGRGGVVNRFADPNSQTQDENIKTPWHPGRLLGVVEVEAKDSPSESFIKEGVAFIEAGESEQAIVQEEIPPGYEDIVRGYFGEGE